MQLEQVATFTNPGSGTGFGNAWSPSGDRLAVAGYADSVLVWDINSGEQVMQAQHPGTVSCVSWSPDGRTIASGTSAGEIHLFSAELGKELRRAGGHTDEVRSVAHSPNGEHIATAANDGTVRIWGAADLDAIATISAHASLARSVGWAPNSASLASGGHDNVVRVWSAGTWAANGELADHTGWIPKVAYSPDGRFLASGSMDKTIRLWDLAGQRYHRVLTSFDDWWIFDFAFSPDSQYLAALTNDPAVFVVDVETGEPVTTTSANFGATAITWSPDGQRLATSGHETQLWTLAA